MKSKNIQNAVCLFVFLLCGIIFGGIRVGENPLSSLVSGLFGAVCAFLVCRLYIKVKNNVQKERLSVSTQRFMSFSGVVFACLICAANSVCFVENLEGFSQKLSGARFSHFFIVLCLVLCAYSAKRGFESFSRICLIMLIPVVLPYVVSWFAFIGYSTPAQAIMPSVSFVPDTHSFFSVFSGCIQLAAFFTTFRKTEIVSPKGLRYAFPGFCAVFVLESVKYFLFFGAKGVSAIQRPDRIMLAAVPFVNVQDIFVFSYFFAFILRNVALFAASSKLIQKAFPDSENVALSAILPAVLSYVLYIVCRVLPGFCEFSRSPVPAVLFAAFVLAAGFNERIKQNK